MVVENKTGASGAIAAEQVKSAPADGHTLMWTISTTLIMNKVLFKKLPYDPDKDFVPISWMDAGHLPTILHKSVPAAGLNDFAQHARNNKVSLGTYGAGSYSHVAVAALNRHFGLTMEAVHYRGRGADVGGCRLGRGPGRQRQLRRSVQRAADRQWPGDRGAHQGPHEEAARCANLLRAGRYRRRLPGARLHRARWGRQAMPKEIVLKLSDMMVELGKSDRIQKILTTFGIDMAAQDHVYFEKYLAEEGPIWIELVKGLNMEPQ